MNLTLQGNTHRACDVVLMLFVGYHEVFVIIQTPRSLDEISDDLGSPSCMSCKNYMTGMDSRRTDHDGGPILPTSTHHAHHLPPRRHRVQEQRTVPC